MIGWYENSVWRMVRPKDVIGRYEKSVRRMIRPKDVIGRYETFVRRMVRPKDAIGRYKNSVRRMIRPKDAIVRHRRWSVWRSLWRNLIGLKRNLVRMTMHPTCCPARLIWLDEKGNLSYLLGHFWLADPLDLSCWNAFDWLIQLICFQCLLLTPLFFLLRDFIQPYLIDKKRLREIVFFWRRIRRSDLLLTRKKDKTNVTFVYLL